MNDDEGVRRTAPATPGLLIILTLSHQFDITYKRTYEFRSTDERTYKFWSTYVFGSP